MEICLILPMIRDRSTRCLMECLLGVPQKTSQALLHSINKIITTLFCDNIRFTLILIRLQKEQLSLYCNLTHISSQIFTSLVLNCAPIGTCKVVHFKHESSYRREKIFSNTFSVRICLFNQNNKNKWQESNWTGCKHLSLLHPLGAVSHRVTEEGLKKTETNRLASIRERETVVIGMATG
jgi:hypothetical protein